MRIERVVINASPLITLFRAGLHPLLPKLFPDLVVPDAVWAEVVNRTYDDPATRGLPGSAWAQKLETSISQDVMEWRLGAGETAVLSYAQHNRDYTAIVDDREARRCALGHFSHRHGRCRGARQAARLDRLDGGCAEAIARGGAVDVRAIDRQTCRR